MSINAIEVLEARFAKREQFVGRGQLHGAELKLVEGHLVPPIYHSPEWWDMMWQEHEVRRDKKTYTTTAGTVWGVTPVTGDS